VEQALVDNVYQTLLTMDSERAISANVAARWSESTDGLHYSFQLREGATFADGSPLNASAVVASLQRTIQDRQVGADDLKHVASVENPDETTVVITLHEPNPRLLEALAGRAGVIVNPNAHDADFAHTSYGSGPFTVSSFTGDTIELARNERYWQDKPALARVTLRYMPSDEALVGGMRDGSLDVALPQGAQAASELAKIDGVQVSDGISTRKTLVAFNNAGSSPFSDEQVRQFTRFAIDAAQIARTQPEAEAQLSGPISQLQPGYEDLNALFPFDLERAQSMRWYFASGYFTPFTLLADEAHRDLAQRIVDEMAAIPMPVTLEVVDSATLASRVEAGDYVCALIEMDEPHDYTRFVDGSAMFGYQNGAAQEQYAKALAQTDFTSYCEQLRAFDRIVSQDAASAWLYTGTDYIAARQNLHVPQANLIDWRLPLYQIA
jgi:ABC-type transport system substrate-binding protein